MKFNHLRKKFFWSVIPLLAASACGPIPQGGYSSYSALLAGTWRINGSSTTGYSVGGMTGISGMSSCSTGAPATGIPMMGAPMNGTPLTGIITSGLSTLTFTGNTALLTLLDNNRKEDYKFLVSPSNTAVNPNLGTNNGMYQNGMHGSSISISMQLMGTPSCFANGASTACSLTPAPSVGTLSISVPYNNMMGGYNGYNGTMTPGGTSIPANTQAWFIGTNDPLCGGTGRTSYLSVVKTN